MRTTPATTVALNEARLLVQRSKNRDGSIAQSHGHFKCGTMHLSRGLSHTFYPRDQAST